VLPIWGMSDDTDTADQGGSYVVYAGQPPFWALPGALLTGTAAAGGIALINSIGQLGSGVGPTSSDNTALIPLALAAVICAIAVVAVGHDRRMGHVRPQGRHQKGDAK